MKNNLWIIGILLSLGICINVAMYGVGQIQAQAQPEEHATLRDPVQVLQALSRFQPELTNSEVELVFQSRLEKSKRYLAKSLAQQLVKSAKHYNLSVSMVLALIDAESSFKFTAHSHKGAVGLMQLLPSTASFIAKREGIAQYRTRKDLRNPTLNLELGIAYLAYLKNRFPSSIHYIAAYNLGPNTVQRKLASEDGFELGAIGPYVTKIHREASRLKRERSSLQELVMNSL